MRGLDRAEVGRPAPDTYPLRPSIESPMSVVRDPDDLDPAWPHAPKNGRVVNTIKPNTPMTCSLQCGCWYLLSGERAVICYVHEVEDLERLFSEKSTST